MSYITENTTGLTPEMIAQVYEKRRRDALRDEQMKIDNAIKQVQLDVRRAAQSFPDLSDPDIFKWHWNFLHQVAEDIVLAPQRPQLLFQRVGYGNGELLYHQQQPQPIHLQ